MPRPVTHFQILAKNPERAAEFYAAVFGQTASDANAMASRELDTGDTMAVVADCEGIPFGLVRRAARS